MPLGETSSSVEPGVYIWAKYPENERNKEYSQLNCCWISTKLAYMVTSI